MLPERLYVQRGRRAWLRLTLPERDAAALADAPGARSAAHWRRWRTPSPSRCRG